MTAQFQLPTPSSGWLRQRSHVGPCDRPRRQHIKSLAALNNTAVDDEVHHMNSLRTQLSSETLRESAHCKLPHRKHLRARNTLNAGSRPRNEDTAAAPW